MRKTKTPKEFFKPLLNILKKSNKTIVPKELDYVSGLEVREQNPDELINSKGKDLTLYDTMLLDDVISSTIELKKRLLLSIPYSVVPASEDDEDVAKADFVNENIDNLSISFNNQLDNFLDAWIYGFKIAEKIWETKDGKWFWKNWKHKHSIFFTYKYDDAGDVETLEIGKNYGSNIQVTGAKNILNKFIIYVNPYPVDGNWYGESDLMGIYTQYHQKYYTYRWRGTYLQGYGSPIPIVSYDKNSVSSSEYNTFTEMLDNWQDTMYVMIPSVRDPKSGELKKKFEVEFKELASSKSGTPYDTVIEKLNTDMRRKLLIPDKMGFTDSPGGSYSLGETQFDILKMIIRDGHTKLEETINPHIRELIDLNFANNTKYPNFEFNELSDKIEKDMLQLLIEKKVVSRHEKWIRSRLQLQQLSKEEQQEIDELEKEDAKKMIETQQAMKPKDNSKDDSKDNGKKDDDNGKPTFNKKIEFKTISQKGKVIKKIYDDSEIQFVEEYSKLYKSQIENLIKQVTKRKLIENKDLKGVDTLVIKKNKLKELFTSYYNKLYVAGKVSAIDNIKDKIENVKLNMKDITTIDDKWLSRNYIKNILDDIGTYGIITPEDTAYLSQLKDQAFFLSGSIESDMIKKVYSAIKEGLDSGDTIANISKKISANLTSDLKRYSTTIARTNASDAFNSGRMNFFNSQQMTPFIEAYQYSAVIDDATTEFCRSHDEQIIKANDPLLGIINPPNHFNCRSIVLPIMTGEGDIKGSEYYDYQDKTSVWGTNVPIDSRLPATGFGGI